jgi:hypothetical protein
VTRGNALRKSSRAAVIRAAFISNNGAPTGAGDAVMMGAGDSRGDNRTVDPHVR